MATRVGGHRRVESGPEALPQRLYGQEKMTNEMKEFWQIYRLMSRSQGDEQQGAIYRILNKKKKTSTFATPMPLKLIKGQHFCTSTT